MLSTRIPFENVCPAVESIWYARDDYEYFVCNVYDVIDCIDVTLYDTRRDHQKTTDELRFHRVEDVAQTLRVVDET